MAGDRSGDGIYVIDDGHVARELSRCLPAGFTVRQERALGDVTGAGAIVLVRPTTVRVRRARADHPDTPVLAVVDEAASPSRVMALIDAGADACVRAGRTVLLAALAAAYVPARALATT